MCWYKSKFADYLGWGLAVFLLLVGLGSCHRLAGNTGKPYIAINTEGKKDNV